MTPQWKNRADYSSLQSTIDAIPDGTHGVVYIPPGIWTETQRAIVPSTKNISFIGDGLDRSVLSWTQANGGIQVNMGNYERTSVLRDLTLETQTSGGGQALEVIGVVTGSSPFRTVHITGVSVRPNNIGNGNYWNYGFVLRDCWQAHLEGIHFLGHIQTFDSTAGIYLSGASVNAHVIGYHAGSVRYAIQLAEDSVTEGLNVTAGKWVWVETGLQAITGTNSGLTMVGVHIDSHLAGVRLGNRHYAELIGLTISKSPASTEGFIGMELVSSDFCRIQTSNIGRPGEVNNLSNNGIVLTGSSYSIINGNGIRGMDTGIWIKPGSQQNTIIGNRGLFNNLFIFDQGNDNLIDLNANSN